MPNSGDHDMRRAADWRAMAKKAKDPTAKAAFEDAANRLERRAASKASKVGRRRKKKVIQ